MQAQLNFETFKSLCQNAERIVITREINADQFTPISAFQVLSKDKKEAVLLDLSAQNKESDVSTYIGLDPFAKFTAYGNKITINNGNNTETRIDHPLDALRDFYHQFRCSSSKSIEKLAGGIIGFLAYDAVRQIENISDHHENHENIPDFCFKFYGTHLIFHKHSGKVTIAKIIQVTKDFKKNYLDATKAINQIIKKITTENSSVPRNKNFISHVEVDIDDIGYIDMVKKAKTAIKKGEVFQIVLSREFRQSFDADDFDVYRALRTLNPSSYQFYLRDSNFTVVGSSPERLVSLKNGIVETMPIAGTRPRGITKEEDLSRENELKNNKKELAEHMMLVDLSRNDIGSIAVPGSINIINLAEIRRYYNVMHIVSRIQGKLRKNCDAFDVLRATFPAGTLSGAPKIRAMELIDEIEASRRGIYGGAICAIDNQGQMDSCITIRTALIKNGMATVRAGAGIVMDSIPQQEADETRQKVQGVLKALALAQRGLV